MPGGVEAIAAMHNSSAELETFGFQLIYWLLSLAQLSWLSGQQPLKNGFLQPLSVLRLVSPLNSMLCVPRSASCVAVSAPTLAGNCRCSSGTHALNVFDVLFDLLWNDKWQ
jgi:hypothetical protein